VRLKIRALFFTPEKQIEEQNLSETKKIASKKARAEKIDAVKYSADRGVRLAWNEKFRIKISDPICGKIELPIIYVIQWVEASEHFTLDIHESLEDDRANVDYSTLNATVETTAWVFAHEFGHLIGLPDEYSNDPEVESIIKYYKPDGTLDKALTGTVVGKVKNGPESSIMSTYNSIVLHQRHAWNIAIEIQDFLTKKTGRTITCEITQA